MKKIIKKLFFKFFQIEPEPINIYNFYREDSLAKSNIQRIISLRATISDLAYLLFIEYWFNYICIIQYPISCRIIFLFDNLNEEDFPLIEKITNYIKQFTPASILFSIHNNSIIINSNFNIINKKENNNEN